MVGRRAQRAQRLHRQPGHAAAEHLDLARLALRRRRLLGRRDLAALRARGRAGCRGSRRPRPRPRPSGGSWSAARRARPGSRGSGTAPTAAASGRAGGRRSARRSRRAGGRRRAAARRESRMWKSRSKSGSSIQYGWSSPNGTSTSRQRNGGSRCSRSPTSRQTSLSSSLPAGRGRRVVDGEAAHVPVGPGGLHRQELGVQAGQLAHGLSSSRIPAHPCPPRHGREPARWDDRAVSATGSTLRPSGWSWSRASSARRSSRSTATAINVALPAIAEDLGGGLAGQQWTANAYLLTLSSLLLIGGSLGDVIGERRVFVAGVGRLRRHLAAVRAGADDRAARRRPGAAGRLRRAAHAGRAGGDRAHVPARPSAARRSAPGPPGAASGRCSGRSSAASSWTRRRGAGSS